MVVFGACIVLIASLVSCSSNTRWTTTDGGHSYVNERGGAFLYQPRTMPPYTETITLTRRDPIAPTLDEWKLHSIAPDGSTTLRFTHKGTSNFIVAGPGEAFPKFGEMTMMLREASYAEGTARIEISYEDPSRTGLRVESDAMPEEEFLKRSEELLQLYADVSSRGRGVLILASRKEAAVLMDNLPRFVLPYLKIYDRYQFSFILVQNNSAFAIEASKIQRHEMTDAEYWKRVLEKFHGESGPELRGEQD